MSWNGMNIFFGFLLFWEILLRIPTSAQPMTGIEGFKYQASVFHNLFDRDLSAKGSFSFKPHAQFSMQSADWTEGCTGHMPRPNSYQLQNINAGQWRSSLYLMDNHRVTVCRQKSPYTEIYCQFISIYGKFVTSQTAYFSRAVNSVYCVV